MLTSVAKNILVSSVCFLQLKQSFKHGSKITEVSPPLRDPPGLRPSLGLGARPADGALDATPVGGVGLKTLYDRIIILD